MDSRNRIALTKEALEALGVGYGDWVSLKVDGSKVHIVRVKMVEE